MTFQILDIINPTLEMEKMGHRKINQPTQDYLFGG